MGFVLLFFHSQQMEPRRGVQKQRGKYPLFAAPLKEIDESTHDH